MKVSAKGVLVSILALFGGYIVAAQRSDLATFDVWGPSQVAEFESQIATKRPGEPPAIHLAKFDNHEFLFVRNKDGGASLHETQSDVFIVQRGEASLVVGGTMVNPKRIGPHEIRGDSLRGGEQRKIRAGDIVHVAAGVAHEVRLETGQELVFFAIKIDKSDLR
jgi:mannose-6-phosphate isomerase-like protein (cupin superfamily)